ncbi:MAG TPA: orotate phosphoribosyltransferase [Cytophagaceae bacterium]
MIEEEIALALLESGAVKLRPEEPFKWASGWNSPIYCDNRLTLSFPAIRSKIKNALVAAVKEQFSEVEAIAGVATAGIPQGTLIAEVLNLPFLYVRPKPKDHGLENLIEGKITPGQKVVVVEDLISTGGSSLKAVEALKDNGANVLGMVAIFTYGFAVAQDNFSKAKVKLSVLSNYEALLAAALKNNIVAEKDLETLKEWRKDPGAWKK